MRLHAKRALQEISDRFIRGSNVNIFAVFCKHIVCTCRKNPGVFDVKELLMLIWSIVNGILIISYICGLQIENLIIPCILGIQKKALTSIMAFYYQLNLNL